MSQKPDVEGLLQRSGSTETVGPNFVYRGAAGVMVLCIKCVWSMIAAASQDTPTIWVIPPLEASSRYPSIEEEFENRSAHSWRDCVTQELKYTVDSGSNLVGGDRPSSSRERPSGHKQGNQSRNLWDTIFGFYPRGGFGGPDVVSS